MKTAGVDESILKFAGPARVFESQDAAVSAILTGGVVAGDVVVIRYEGPRGGPGMQEMLYPTSYHEIEGARQGLRARHRRTLFRRHVGPLHRPCLAGSGGGRRDRLGREGDRIEIDIPARTITLAVTDAELATRRAAQDAKGLESGQAARAKVSQALRAYAAMTTSAARGAVREVPEG